MKQKFSLVACLGIFAFPIFADSSDYQAVRRDANRKALELAKSYGAYVSFAESFREGQRGSNLLGKTLVGAVGVLTTESGFEDGKQAVGERARQVVRSLYRISEKAERAAKENVHGQRKNFRASGRKHLVCDAEQAYKSLTLPSISAEYKTFASSNIAIQALIKQKQQIEADFEQRVQGKRGAITPSPDNIASNFRSLVSLPRGSEVVNNLLSSKGIFSPMSSQVQVLVEEFDLLFSRAFAEHAGREDSEARLLGAAYAGISDTLAAYRQGWMKGLLDKKEGLEKTARVLAKNQFLTLYAQKWHEENNRYATQAVIEAKLRLEFCAHDDGGSLPCFDLKGLVQNLGDIDSHGFRIELQREKGFRVIEHFESWPLPSGFSSEIIIPNSLQLEESQFELSQGLVKFRAKIAGEMVQVPLMVDFRQILDGYVHAINPEKQAFLARMIVFNLKKEWENNHGLFAANIFAEDSRDSCYLKQLVMAAESMPQLRGLASRVVVIYEEMGLTAWFARWVTSTGANARALASRL